MSQDKIPESVNITDVSKLLPEIIKSWADIVAGDDDKQEDIAIKEESEEGDEPEDPDEEEEESKSESVTPKDTPINIVVVERKVQEDVLPHDSANYAYTPLEVLANMKDFEVHEGRSIHKDSFRPVTFRGRTCIIETPVCVTLFGLKGYRNPGSKILKHSLNLSLGANGSKEMEDFKKLLFKIDEWAKKYTFHENDVYWSSIRKSNRRKRKPPILRIKLPCIKDHAQIDLYKDNFVLHEPDLEDLQEYIKHRTTAKCIIAVNPIWQAGKKYGISYKLLKIKCCEPYSNIKFR